MLRTCSRMPNSCSMSGPKPALLSFAGLTKVRSIPSTIGASARLSPWPRQLQKSHPSEPHPRDYSPESPHNASATIALDW